MTIIQSPRRLGASPTSTRSTTQLATNRDSRTFKKGGLALNLWLDAVMFLGLLHSAAAQIVPDGVCGNPFPGYSRTLNVPPYYTKRPPVASDYVVIQYNASQHTNDPTYNLTSWTDYNHIFGQSVGQIIQPNGSFLPVVYTKEKIAVRVCGLHFTDVLTVTTSPNGLPEGGADIRGASPVTPPASLSGTLDMLQSGTATGGTTTLPGLGLNAATAVPSLTLSGITPGNLGPEEQKRGTHLSYNPAIVTASGKQVALLLYSVAANAKELSRLICRTMGQSYPAFRIAALTPPGFGEPGEALMNEADIATGAPEGKVNCSDVNGGAGDYAPGSVIGVNNALKSVLNDVVSDSNENDPGSANNSAAFDRDMTNIQNLNAQISTLAGALSSQAFASNTLTLLNNYSTLVGVLDLATLVRYPQYCRQGVDSAEDKPPCSLFEKQKMKDFWHSYNEQVGFIVHQIASEPAGPDRDADLACEAAGVPRVELVDPWKPHPNLDTEDGLNPNDAPILDQFETFAGCRLGDLRAKLNALRAELRGIDQQTTSLYNDMNNWYSRSSVEQTDLLPPLPTNAFVRISIVVQRGYTPFTLTNANGTFTATVTTNMPATASAANTSTPAHAVKTILAEVHRLANFNLAGGAMFIHIPTASYAIQASPTLATLTSSGATTYTAACGSTTATVTTQSYGCVVRTQQTDWQLAAMAGLVWFPWGHDYFPRHNGFANYGRNLLPSLLIATSVSTLGNSMVGVNWEPVSGIDFSAGLGSAHRTVLPSALMVNTPVASMTTLSTVTQEHAGFTFGFGVDLSVFTTIFGAKTSAASQP